MPAPENKFKKTLLAGQLQIGLWLGLATANSAELCGYAGFDWLVVDGEHTPSDLPLITSQLQALAASPSEAVVRVPIGETWMIKQFLDAGAQTILVPMVEDAAQAAELVKAMRYPPAGVRGVGSALARASKYNTIPDYLTTANEQVCLLVQVESANAMKNIEAIAALDGVDGVFIGPSDLAADMGFIGKAGAPEVNAAVEDGIKRILAQGKPAGVLTGDLMLAQNYIDLGATFVAVGSDVGLLTKSAGDLAKKFKS
jgi:4-hydroxy-2-oxoheptanedioate aldolase